MSSPIPACTRPLQVLILENSTADQQLIASTLTRNGFVLRETFASSEHAFRTALGQTTFDVILSNFNLPAYSGTEALALARQLQPDTPFVFVSDLMAEECAVEALRAGATDYVLKTHLERLPAAVRRALNEAGLRRDQRQANERLRASEERFRILFEYAPDAFYLYDLQGRLTDGNKAAEKLSGYRREELIGKTLFELNLLSTEGTTQAAKGLERNARGEATGPDEYSLEKKDGTKVQVEMRAYPMLVLDQMLVLAIARDITERKQAEADLRASEQRLRAAPEELPPAVKRDISHETQLEAQLRQAQKMDAIGQLAGGVAHDFNNLLLVMRGNAELLMMDADQLPEPFKEGLKQITAAAERAASLTRQLLAFSRKQVMQSQPLLLNDVIANLTKMLKRIIGEHIDLQCHYGANLPFIEADAGMIEQVLVNLVINARDAMPQGGQLHFATEKTMIGEAYAQTNPEARSGEFACLTVRDSGTGIAAEHLPRIFEPFFTTKPAGKGTGLGLATAYGIVKQHHGWIELFSQLGTGTTFRLFFPAVPPPANKTSPQEPERPPKSGTETILLVEDEQAVRRVTRRVLESAGYTVHEATSAREALEQWEDRLGEIALLLTDIVMPEGITGRELSEKLRVQRPDLKVILISGYSADVAGKNTEFFRRTKTQFLQKPCSSRLLLETVRRSLDER